MLNIKKNILPNIVFVLAVIVIPVCFMLVATIGNETDALLALAK